MYVRPLLEQLLRRLREPRRFIQVLAGARQVGKTTLARQAAERLEIPVVFASADDPMLRDRVWVEQQWDRAEFEAAEAGGEVLLVLDEVQKVPQWSDVVKSRWDRATHEHRLVKVLVLGSSPLLMQQGLTESLAGRFELIRVPHWTYSEMRDAFDWDVEKYVFYGGYPGAAPLIDDPERWAAYVRDSLIETTISRDVLLMTRVAKPALLRRLFELGCRYSGQIVSYQKMVGQLQDAGNTTTLAHYLDLLRGAGMLAGLQKYSGEVIRSRASSPKLQVLNTALMTVASHSRFSDVRRNPERWGHVVESAVGAHLVNESWCAGAEVSYWRHRNSEVDFVVSLGTRLAAIEVKSGRAKGVRRGMEAFDRAFHPQRKVLVGAAGVTVERFLETSVDRWLD